MAAVAAAAVAAAEAAAGPYGTGEGAEQPGRVHATQSVHRVEELRISPGAAAVPLALSGVGP